MVSRVLACFALFAKLAHAWTRYEGLNCYAGMGATDLEPEVGKSCGRMSLDACKAKCDELANCQGITTTTSVDNSSVDCYRRKDVTLAKCQEVQGFDTYLRFTYSPTPAPTSPDVSSCKRTAKYQEDVNVCQEFYDAQVGVAFTMISKDVWNLLGKSDYGNMDRAIFNVEPPVGIQNFEQAVSIVNHQKGSFPFPNAGSAYGLLLSVGPHSNFWQYFWACNPGVLSADCKDRSAPPFPGSSKFQVCTPSYHTMAELDYTYEKFVDQKNTIVDVTGNAGCAWKDPSSYNEFDVNGLSNSAFAGILTSDTVSLKDKPIPDDGTMCRFLADRGLHRAGKQWPVWLYQPVPREERSALVVDRYLNCGSEAIIV